MTRPCQVWQAAWPRWGRSAEEYLGRLSHCRPSPVWPGTLNTMQCFSQYIPFLPCSSSLSLGLVRLECGGRFDLCRCCRGVGGMYLVLGVLSLSRVVRYGGPDLSGCSRRFLDFSMSSVPFILGRRRYPDLGGGVGGWSSAGGMTSSSVGGLLGALPLVWRSL